MSTKREVMCDLYNEEQKRVVVEGRLLGYITEEEFAIIICHANIQKGVSTSGTIPLSDLNKSGEKLLGKRLVLEMKKMNGEVEIRKKLFITDVITETLCYTERISSGIEYMSLETRHRQWLALTEY